MKVRIKHDPVRERIAAYPSITDQLDAIYKGFKKLHESGMVELPWETVNWILELQRIKRDFPKDVSR